MRFSLDFEFTPPPSPYISPESTLKNDIRDNVPSKTLVVPRNDAKKPRIAHNHKVHPHAPRRNLSSFVMFANHRRSQLKSDCIDMSYPEIQTMISSEWKDMPTNTRTTWKNEMEKEKVRYKRQMKLYKDYGSMWPWVEGYAQRNKLVDEGKLDRYGSCDTNDTPRLPSSSPRLGSRVSTNLRYHEAETHETRINSFESRKKRKYSRVSSRSPSPDVSTKLPRRHKSPASMNDFARAHDEAFGRKYSDYASPASSEMLLMPDTGYSEDITMHYRSPIHLSSPHHESNTFVQWPDLE